MTFLGLILRGLRFRARAHLGVLVGAAVGSAVLVGALVVGDSVRGSLRALALERLGQVHYALSSGDRLFRTELGRALGEQIGRETLLATVLQLRGTAANEDGSARANQVNILGVTAEFFRFAPSAAGPTDWPDDGVALNRSLAQQLQVTVGATVLLRVPKPSQLSRDAPLSPEEDASAAVRLRVHQILEADQFGNMGLSAHQVAPNNAFVPYEVLSKLAGVPGRANLILAGDIGGASAALDAPISARAARLTQGLASVWQLPDLELELRNVPLTGQAELRSRRVFLDPPMAQAFGSNSPVTGILTYLVNEIRVGDRPIPYSMVAAMAQPPGPNSADATGTPGLQDDEVVINAWLAEQAQARPGDTLTLSYYVAGPGRQLLEQRSSFRIRAIVPLEGAAADRTLMPDFPGLTDADNCRDWDAGFPIKTDQIRDVDEKYWDDYRGTPKAFVTLAAGQRMWSNRFGDLTALRFPPALATNVIAEQLLTRLRPEQLGLRFEPVRERALQASAQGQDFGQLFLGFSFFLIAAALILMSLLFRFGVEQRRAEMGTLLAVGYLPGRVRTLLWGEGLALAAVGTMLGLPGGLLYARGLLWGLSTLWLDAVGTSSLSVHTSATTLGMGAFAAAAVGALTIGWSVRRQAREPARTLLAEGAEDRRLQLGETFAPGRPVALLLGVGCWLAAGGLVVVGGFRGHGQSAGLFFGAGALVLLGGCALALAALGFLMRHLPRVPRLRDLGLRNAARRPQRSLAVLGLLSSGTFLVAAIGSFRLDAEINAAARSSGTGGFAWLGESSLPVSHDLNAAEGRDYFGLDARSLEGVSVVPLRVRDGDEASCLNLNRAQKPRLLGVAPERLAERRAFTFAQLAAGISPEDPWRALEQPSPDGSIPVIGDAASVQWALGKRVGDTLDYMDDRGQTMKLRIVATLADSILQGQLILAEKEFVRRFSETGYRMFLIDGPSNPAIAATLTRAMQDVGLELVPAARRLAAYHAVQNTYLSTFQVLGGLGLLLGSLGLGVVVLRNVLERRSELALLLAVGFRRRTVLGLVWSEHAALLGAGWGLGILAAAVSVLPSWLAPGAPPVPKSLLLTLAAVLSSGALVAAAAAFWAVRGRLVDALHQD